MYISRFQLKNFKSIRETPRLALTQGFTVIIGENNVGKSALAEGLSLHFAEMAHRSQSTVRRPSLVPPPGSTAEVSFSLAAGEFEELIVDHLDSTYIAMRNDEPNDPESIRKLLAGPATIRASVGPGQQLQNVVWEERGDLQSNWSIPLKIDKAARTWSVQGQPVGVNRGQTAPYAAANQLLGRIYMFNAQRFNVGRGSAGTSEVLQANASNLPEVLGVLQSKRWSFSEFNRAVSIVLPQVQWVSVHEIGNRQLEIRISGDEAVGPRDDLAIGLNESGTGIGQVLAVLYVVLTAHFPRIIIIDEPQSFLHPGAARKLLELLRQHREHQYIITSHSPTAITAAYPERILHLRKSGAQTEIRQLDARAPDELREVLVDVGARFGDVFGAENILWVEGPTEERCFPLLIEKLAKRLLLGTTVLGVVSTGDLQGRHARKAYEIYGRLTKRGVLLPPAYGFIFDREGRSQAEMDELERASGGKVRFLPRRTYENYLLAPAAIAFVLSELDRVEGSVHTHSRNDVEEWIQARGTGNKFNDTSSHGMVFSSDWFESVNAPRLLSNLFEELSDHRVAYMKTRDSLALTQWLTVNDPEQLRELADFVSHGLPAAV